MERVDKAGIMLARLFSGGRAVIVACDHGEFDGPIAGMEDFRATAAKIDPSVDGVLLSPGMIRFAGTLFGRRGSPLAVGRLNWDTVYCFRWGYRDAPAVEAFSPEEAASLGVEIALVSLTLRTGDEERDARNVAVFRSLAAGCRRVGLPVIGEYFPAAAETRSPEELHDEILTGCRILAELGADAIKTFHTTRFPEVVAGCPAPILALGAAKLPTPLDALALAAREVADGARGVVFGRNALQVADPPSFQKALCAVVREGADPAAAAARFGLKGGA